MQSTAILLLFFFCTSCKKDDKEEADPNAYKIEWVTGTWKQKDLVLGVDAPIAPGTTIPAGTSLIQLASLGMLDPILGPQIPQILVMTSNNVYSFNGDGTYQIDGIPDIFLPVAGHSGKWELTVYNAVLELTNEDNDKDPHWINSISPDDMELAITLSIPGVGDLPLALQLIKQ